MAKLADNRVASSPLLFIAVTTVTLLALSTPQHSFAQATYQDSESLRADLLTVLHLQQSIQQDIDGQSSEVDPSLALLETAINEANALTPEELAVLQKANFSLAPALENLKELDSAIAKDRNPKDRNQIAVQATGTSQHVDNCDGYVEAAGELDDPPGPCGQSNYIPPNNAEPSLGFNPPQLTLTDNDYPVFPTCDGYQPARRLFTLKKIVIALDITATVARRVCDQIYTVGGVGANFALVCLVTDAAKLIAERAEHYGAAIVSYCHSFRVASEGTSTYVRAGELFVQSKNNTNIIATRADAGFNDSLDGLSDIKNQVNENSLKIEQTIRTLNEIMRTMDIDDARLIDTNPEL